MAPYWSPTSYLDSAVHDVLTAEPPGVAATVAHAAVLLMACGATEPCDRLVGRWQAATGRAVTELAAEPVRARAWTVLLAHRTSVPEWAAELPSRDLDEVDREHQRYLSRGESTLPDDLARGLAAGAASARVTNGINEVLGAGAQRDPLRSLTAQADALATRGAISAAVQTLERWTAAAAGTTRPDVAMLAACRGLAPLLLDGVLTGYLDIPANWPEKCAGELAAALHTRFATGERTLDCQELIDRIMWLRTAGEEPEPTSPPASPADVEATELALGTTLPEDYRQFLLTCDGLPADVVFPRLLGVSELQRSGGEIPLSATATEHGESTAITLVERASRWCTVEWDSTLGLTEYSSFRALLEHHLRLLEDG